MRWLKLFGAVAGLAFAGWLLAPHNAYATGESYQWVDAKTFTGTGGVFSVPATFVKVNDNPLLFQTSGKVNLNDPRCSQGEYQVRAIGTDRILKDAVGTLADLAPAAGGCKANIDTVISVKAPAGPPQTAPPATPAPSASASIDGNCRQKSGVISWFMCPIINLGVETVGTMTKIVAELLKVTPLDPNGQLETLWAALRDLANIAFVFVFLAIIFGTTFGLSNYTIKKTLPKLIAAAILVQFSWFICSIAIDIGNILGQGIGTTINVALKPCVSDANVTTLAQNPTSSAQNPIDRPDANLATTCAQAQGKDNNFWLDPSRWIQGIFAGLTGVLAAGIAIFALWAMGLSVALLTISALAVSLFGVFLSLAARQLILSMLIVLSPLAIVAWVLPNTQSMFKYWYKNLTKLILMYPLIILIMSVSTVVSKAAQASSNTDFNNLLAAIIPIIAFASIPATFKMSGSLMSLVSGAILKRSQGYSGKIKSSEAMHRAKELRKESGFEDAEHNKNSKVLNAWGAYRSATGNRGSRALTGAKASFGGFKKWRGAQRAGTVGAFTPEIGPIKRSRAAVRKQAAGYASAVSAQMKDATEVVRNLGLNTNPHWGKIAMAWHNFEEGHGDGIYRGVNEAGQPVTLKVNEWMAAAALDRLGAQSGMPELEQFYDGLIEDETGLYIASDEAVAAGRARVHTTRDGIRMDVTENPDDAQWAGAYDHGFRPASITPGTRTITNPDGTTSTVPILNVDWAERRLGPDKKPADAGFRNDGLRDAWQRYVTTSYGAQVNQRLRYPAHGAMDGAMEDLTASDQMNLHAASYQVVKRILENPYRGKATHQKWLIATVSNSQNADGRTLLSNNKVLQAIWENKDQFADLSIDVPNLGVLPGDQALEALLEVNQDTNGKITGITLRNPEQFKTSGTASAGPTGPVTPTGPGGAPAPATGPIYGPPAPDLDAPEPPPAPPAGGVGGGRSVSAPVEFAGEGISGVTAAPRYQPGTPGSTPARQQARFVQPGQTVHPGMVVTPTSVTATSAPVTPAYTTATTAQTLSPDEIEQVNQGLQQSFGGGAGIGSGGGNSTPPPGPRPAPNASDQYATGGADVAPQQQVVTQQAPTQTSNTASTMVRFDYTDGRGSIWLPESRAETLEEMGYGKRGKDNNGRILRADSQSGRLLDRG